MFLRYRLVSTTGVFNAYKARDQSMRASFATTAYGRIRGVTEESIHASRDSLRCHDSRCRTLPCPYSTYGLGRRARCTRLPVLGPHNSPITLGRLFSSWTFDSEMSEDCLALNVWAP